MKTQTKFQSAAAALLLLSALGCLFFPYGNANLFFWLSAVILTASSAGLWVEAFRKKSGLDFAAALLLSFLCLYLLFGPMPHYELILIIFAAYMVFCGTCELVQLILDFQEKANNAWVHGLMTFFYYALAIASLVYRRDDLKLLMLYFALYLLVQAVQLIVEIYFIKRPSSSRSFALRKWVSLPVYLVSFLPGIYLRYMLRSQYARKPLSYDQRKNDAPVNLRVFIHTGLTGEHMVGHMTFAIEGIMYSYGNYDKAEEKFFRTVGPGIFFTAPADIYVNNSCIVEKSTLYEYGLHITPQQMASLKNAIAHIFDITYPWICPLEATGDPDENFKAYESDYASRLWYRTGAQFRKFKSSQWKIYWILGDNCSLFAEDMLAQAGFPFAHKSGIIAPGEYFEYFETAYADPKSNVVSKSWHDASEPATLFPGRD